MKKLLYLIFATLITVVSASGQNQNPQNWQLLGKVQAYYSIEKRRSHGEEAVYEKAESAFLYATFDGEKMKYKIFVAADNRAYDVSQNASYTGATVKYSRNMKYVTYLPSLSEMYPQKAGPYYLNVDRCILAK